MLRPISSLAVAIGLAVLVLTVQTPTVRGFMIQPDFCREVECPTFRFAVHEDITTEALGRLGWSDEAIRQTILGIQGADIFHALSGVYDSRLHFHSNKRSPTSAGALDRLKIFREYTVLYDNGDNFTFDGDFALIEDLYGRIRDGQPYHDRRESFSFSEYAQTDEAFYIFGLILHAAQDFYAHTTYLDLKMRDQPASEVRIPERFELDSLPSEIESGFACPCDPLRKLPRNVQRILMQELGLSFLHDDHNYDTPDKPHFEHARRLAIEETVRQGQRFRDVAPERLRHLLG